MDFGEKKKVFDLHFFWEKENTKLVAMKSSLSAQGRPDENVTHRDEYQESEIPCGH